MSSGLKTKEDSRMWKKDLRRKERKNSKIQVNSLGLKHVHSMTSLGVEMKCHKNTFKLRIMRGHPSPASSPFPDSGCGRRPGNEGGSWNISLATYKLCVLGHVIQALWDSPSIKHLIITCLKIRLHKLNDPVSVAQSCLTLCDPRDSGSPDPSVSGILKTNTEAVCHFLLQILATCLMKTH